MGKSHGREGVSIAATSRSVSESKAFFFDGAFDSGFDRGAGAPESQAGEGFLLDRCMNLLGLESSPMG